MYYLYLFLRILNLDQFFSDAGVVSLNNAMSTFTRAEQKLNVAISQLEKSEDNTKLKMDKLREEFNKREIKLNQLKVNLVDNKVKSQKYLKKIKSFLED